MTPTAGTEIELWSHKPVVASSLYLLSSFFFFFFPLCAALLFWLCSRRIGCAVMGKSSARLPSFCLNRIATRVRVRSPPIESKPPSPKATDQLPEKETPDSEEKTPDKATNGKEVELGRRIMVVVDSNPEAKAALQWALSHSVQSNDTVVLIDVVKPSKGEQCSREKDPKCYKLLHAMRSICQAKRPEVQVEVCLVEGRERGPSIVDEASKQGVALLVMGQKKRSMTWRLIMLWAGSNSNGSKKTGERGGSVAEYCVQNATCMALAVRRKSRRAGGGYLITTKRHKDFWLLA